MKVTLFWGFRHLGSNTPLSNELMIDLYFDFFVILAAQSVGALEYADYIYLET